LVLLVSAALPALANADLAHKKSCGSCHAMDSKRVGPSYRAIAARYGGNSGAESALTAKVLNGGGGAWGAVPMPANNQVTEDEAMRIVQWILSVK
jgi:cytochrome c